MTANKITDEIRAFILDQSREGFERGWKAAVEAVRAIAEAYPPDSSERVLLRSAAGGLHAALVDHSAPTPEGTQP